METETRLTARSLRLGTRGSPLARWQAAWIRRGLESLHADLRVDVVVIRTQGDRDLHASLTRIGGKGVFTKEIEAALLEGAIDVAVHSLKDLPTTLPEGLTTPIVPVRADPHDALVARQPGTTLADLPAEATLATDSLRRRAQLRAARPDLRFETLRGNLQTRFRKFTASSLAGMVLAKAGLDRADLADRISWVIPPSVCLPAPGQGALGIEVRTDDAATRALLAPLNDPDAQDAVTAERALLTALGGGCQVPVGALATVNGASLTLHGVVAALDGSVVHRGR